VDGVRLHDPHHIDGDGAGERHGLRVHGGGADGLGSGRHETSGAATAGDADDDAAKVTAIPTSGAILATPNIRGGVFRKDHFASRDLRVLVIARPPAVLQMDSSTEFYYTLDGAPSRPPATWSAPPAAITSSRTRRTDRDRGGHPLLGDDRLRSQLGGHHPEAVENTLRPGGTATTSSSSTSSAPRTTPARSTTRRTSSTLKRRTPSSSSRACVRSATSRSDPAGVGGHGRRRDLPGGRARTTSVATRRPRSWTPPSGTGPASSTSRRSW